MNNVMLPEDCAKQWEILLLLIASEEKKIDRTNESEVDTMSYFLKNEGVKHILLQWIRQMHTTYGKKVGNCDTARKSDDISLIWRQRGNEKFRANLVNDSYKCYTKSVVYANQNGPMYSLALANRSAALLRLKRFEEALADIALALEEGYPKDLCHKLMLRRADCYIEMSQRDKAIEAIAAASQHAASVELSSVQTADFDRHVKILERKMEVVAIEEVTTEDVLPDCYKGEGDTFTAASSVLELRRSDTVGRYVVTREATRRGDVLFSEEPYAWVPLPCELPICDGCCAAHINLIPCAVCSRSAYCNYECRTRAIDYHKYECKGAQADILPTIGIAHLALRVLLVSTTSGFPELPAGTPLPKKASDLFAGYANVDDIEIYHKDTHPFYRMFNLVTNFEKMNNMDYIQYALTSTMLILYLDHFTSFFEHLPGRVPYTLGVAQMRLFAGALMLRALGQLVCNGHAALTLAVVDDGEGPTVSEREIRRATAIYPSAAMMNHSCDPTIINTFYKARLIVRGACDLPPGGQALNCYGPHRARDTTSRRRQLLRSQYLFTCSCAACLDIQHRDTVLLFSAYACQQCKGPIVRGKRACAQCHAPFNVQRIADVIEEAEALQTEADRATNLGKRIEKGLAALRVRQRIWYRHHVSLRTATDQLARQLADHGDFNKSVELIKQNIQSLEYQFGSFSVEVAHELRKLSDVMLERIIKTSQNPGYRDWCLETHKVLKKAVQLMDLNYGSWEPLVKRLKEQETLVRKGEEMSAKDMELNLTDGMKHREKKHKDKKQNGTHKRKSRDEDNEEPRNLKRHRRDVSCSDSTGSISSSLSAESPAGEDTSSGGSYVLDNKILEIKVSRVAESLARQNIPGGSSGAGLSGRGLAGPEVPVAGISGAGPRTKAKQKIWYREATATATTSLGLKQNSSEEEKYAAMELEDE